MNTDRIEKTATFWESRSRVRQALRDSTEFAFRWHPAPVDPERDYSREPMTLVAFQLSDVIGGTKLTLTESGFDRLPLERRDEAYRENESGWTQQIASLTRYLTAAA